MTQPMQDQLYNQLEYFRNSLPRICACTDTLGITLYRTRTVAERMRYIDPNHLNSITHLVFDVDRELAVLAAEDTNSPVPNWICPNPLNGHAHLGYSLADPVHFNPDSRRKPQHYLAAIQDALTEKLGADPGYAGKLTKNPLNPYWPTISLNDTAYELDTLGTHLDLIGRIDARKRVEPVGLGRNCTLFDRTRFVAYAQRRIPQGWFSLEYFQTFVYGYALKVNDGFSVPLPEREVHHLAKSIATWTWEHMSPEGFRMWGDNRRAKSIRVRHARAVDRAERIRDLARTFPGATHRELAEMVNLTTKTVQRALKSGTT